MLNAASPVSLFRKCVLCDSIVIETRPTYDIQTQHFTRGPGANQRQSTPINDVETHTLLHLEAHLSEIVVELPATPLSLSLCDHL